MILEMVFAVVHSIWNTAAHWVVGTRCGGSRFGSIAWRRIQSGAGDVIYALRYGSVTAGFSEKVGNGQEASAI
jgi:hypothetical protein